MKPALRKILEMAADVLNDIVDHEPGLCAGMQEDRQYLELINRILENLTEGGRLVASYETDGTLVGFVPKRQPPQPAPVEAEVGKA